MDMGFRNELVRALNEQRFFEEGDPDKINICIDVRTNVFGAHTTHTQTHICWEIKDTNPSLVELVEIIVAGAKGAANETIQTLLEKCREKKDKDDDEEEREPGWNH